MCWLNFAAHHRFTVDLRGVLRKVPIRIWSAILRDQIFGHKWPQVVQSCPKLPKLAQRVPDNIALWKKSNGSYVIKDFVSLSLIFSTPKYSIWKF